MDQMLKQRLIGAVVIISLAVIFIPMILEGPDDKLSPRNQSMPPPPTIDFQGEVALPVPAESTGAQQTPDQTVTEPEVSVRRKPSKVQRHRSPPLPENRQRKPPPGLLLRLPCPVRAGSFRRAVSASNPTPSA